jgi:Tfp pilus tip-associated adhesin PilY1
MKKAISCFTVLTFLMIFNLTLLSSSFADDQDLFTTAASSYKPNVLIILDNSQSMDEDFLGNVVGPWATNSRLLEAKRALQSVIDTYKSTMRIGLMTYRLNSVDDWDIHNATYFTSYDPKSYCPSADATVLAACQDYCITGNVTSGATCQTGCRTAAGTSDFVYSYLDEIIENNAINSDLRKKYCNLIYPKTQRYPNPTSAGNFIYYKLPGTYYDDNPQGNAFCYSTGYNASESVADSYNCYQTKLGTDDGSYAGANPGQYSNYLLSSTFNPTEEDIALGYNDFGRRLSWYHVGRSWYNNTSPGGGFLHVAADTDSSTHYNALTAKLALHENDMAGYMDFAKCSGDKSNSCPFVINAGLTPIAGTLQSAINYFKGQADYKSGVIYTSPIQNHCQKNFIIFITDGLPSADKNGNKGTAAALMPDVLAKIDALRALVKTLGTGGNAQDYSFNILTYVVGVGMRQDSMDQLDTMASRGGTAIGGKALYADDNAGILAALDSTLSDIENRSYAFATSSISSSRTADENFIYEATFEPAGTYPLWKGHLKKWSLKADSSLDAVVWDAGTKLQIKAAGSRNMQTLIGGSLVKFESKDKDGTNYVDYQYFNLTETDPVAAQLAADKIIKYVRGYPTDAAATPPFTNPDDWKLGDIFHSSPITLGTPTPFFVDSKETNPSDPPKKAYDKYREDHPRNSTCSVPCLGLGKRMVIVGANDGQYHALNATTGEEFWSFVPPNLLPKLQYLAHDSASAATGHRFFVDGATTATDAWLPSTPTPGTTKVATDWKTLVMFSLGRNDRDYESTLGTVPDTSTKYWSSSASCDTNISEYYNVTTTPYTPYYCGYYAFDFTDAPTTLPSFKWTLRPGATTASAASYAEAAPYLGEPWSTISTGRVKINGDERWIGVIGGGYNAATCDASTCADKRGKGIIVFDLRNGEILWSYHWGTATSNTTHPDMGNAIPAQVALIDGDYDGYLDHGYFGDMRGNMWQIQFCTKDDLAGSCGTSSWKGSLLLDKLGSDKYPVYMPPTVVRDNSNNIWIYWASGDIVDPMASTPAAIIYGLKPLRCRDASGNPQPCLRSNLDNITSDKNTYCGSVIDDKWGWYINLSGSGEKVLAQPIAFDNVLYLTSFIPSVITSEDDCLDKKTGMALLYGISIDPGINEATCTVGTGKFSGDRSITVGTGIASKVQLSFGPDGTVKAFVTASGAGGQEGGTILAPFNPSETQKRAYMLYWKDKRVE